MFQRFRQFVLILLFIKNLKPYEVSSVQYPFPNLFCQLLMSIVIETGTRRGNNDIKALKEKQKDKKNKF